MEYRIKDYINELNKYGVVSSLNLDTDEKLISKLTYNSKDVSANSLFVCKGLILKVSIYLKPLRMELVFM